jgi:hypothetical protein
MSGRILSGGNVGTAFETKHVGSTEHADTKHAQRNAIKHYKSNINTTVSLAQGPANKLPDGNFTLPAVDTRTTTVDKTNGGINQSASTGQREVTVKPYVDKGGSQQLHFVAPPKK